MPTSLLSRYEAIVASGLIKKDPRQLTVLEKLESLCQQLKSLEERDKGAGILGRLLGHTYFKGAGKQGVYLYGGVGSGKTMLMDLFQTFCPYGGPKERIHYNALMLSIHSQLHALKMATSTLSSSGKDHLEVVCDNLVAGRRVLCLDEFQVIDIADAMILRTLLGGLLARGVYMVITSNRHPRDLYKNGIQRASFLPCIELLEKCLEVSELTGGVDYRQTTQDDAQTKKVPTEISEIKIFQWPISRVTERALEQIFARLSEGVLSGPRAITTPFGRPVRARRAAGRVAWFTFEELCLQPMSTTDYTTLSEAFPIWIISEVPRLDVDDDRDALRRFITLVDVLYDRRVKVLMQLAEPPKALIVQRDEAVTDEAFACSRTLSRLQEMQRPSWWALPQKGHT